ncbi:hypothetical protein MRX96_018548 [Rhipicephalus microplus]
MAGPPANTWRAAAAFELAWRHRSGVRGARGVCFLLLAAQLKPHEARGNGPYRVRLTYGAANSSLCIRFHGKPPKRFELGGADLHEKGGASMARQ